MKSVGLKEYVRDEEESRVTSISQHKIISIFIPSHIHEDQRIRAVTHSIVCGGYILELRSAYLQLHVVVPKIRLLYSEALT